VNDTCLFCGSTVLAVTGHFSDPAGDVRRTYSLCSHCWELGKDAVAMLAEGVFYGGAQTSVN
jgi:hypothetical protein